MDAKQTIMYSLLTIGLFSSIGTGISEVCKKSPRELDIGKCSVSSSAGSINKMSRNNPFVYGHCNVTFPDDVDVLRQLIHFKTLFSSSGQCTSTKSTVEVFNTDGQPLTDEYMPKGADVKISFFAKCEEYHFYSDDEEGYVLMELIFEDQIKYDGWCLMAKVELE